MVFRPPLPIPSTPHFDDSGKPSIQKSQWLTSIDNMFGSFNATPAGNLLGNTTNASALAVPVTLTSLLDAVMGNSRGSILVRGASTWTVLTLGSTSNVLTSNGTDLVYGAAATPGRTLLNTLTAANSATLSDTTSFTNVYASYELVFENLLPGTTNAAVQILLHSGTAFQASGYLVSGMLTLSSGTSAVFTSTSQVAMSDASILNSGGGLSGTARISNPSTNNRHGVWLNSIYESTATLSKSFVAGGYWNTAGVVDGFQVSVSSGTLTSGKVYVYGLL